MIRLIYTALFYLVQPIIWLMMLVYKIKNSHNKIRLSERYGFCKSKVLKNGILVHCSSVGEVFAAKPMIERLLIAYPNLPITVTTMTKTGSAQVKTLFGSKVSHVFLPFDLPGAINRFLNQLQPKYVIILETEIWPNLIAHLSARHIPILIANARLSKKSVKRYAVFGKTIKSLLNKINYIATQSELDYDHFLKLGADNNKMSMTGNIKFDISLSAEQLTNISHLKSQLKLNRPVWIAASTHQGEDEIILQAHQILLKNRSDLLLILVPRHPERFAKVENLIKQQNLHYQLRTGKTDINDSTQVLLLNTMGELLLFYSLANIAFVGGSLINKGGHNPLEPAIFKMPIVIGSHFANFKAICEQLILNKGLFIVDSNAESLASQIELLLCDDNLRVTCGLNAYNILQKNQGAINRLFDVIQNQLLNSENQTKC